MFIVSSENNESAKKYILSEVLIPIISKKCPFKLKYSNPSGKLLSIWVTLEALASKNLFSILLNGNPPYKNEDSSIGFSVKHFSILYAKISQLVLSWIILFPPIWSAFECVFIIPFIFQPCSSTIFNTFLPASLSLPLSIINTFSLSIL